jgi:hypothetical protein
MGRRRRRYALAVVGDPPHLKELRLGVVNLQGRVFDTEALFEEPFEL